MDRPRSIEDFQSTTQRLIDDNPLLADQFNGHHTYANGSFKFLFVRSSVTDEIGLLVVNVGDKHPQTRLWMQESAEITSYKGETYKLYTDVIAEHGLLSLIPDNGQMNYIEDCIYQIDEKLYKSYLKNRQENNLPQGAEEL